MNIGNILLIWELDGIGVVVNVLGGGGEEN
jgi:hypothetical protein